MDGLEAGLEEVQRSAPPRRTSPQPRLPTKSPQSRPRKGSTSSSDSSDNSSSDGSSTPVSSSTSSSDDDLARPSQPVPSNVDIGSSGASAAADVHQSSLSNVSRHYDRAGSDSGRGGANGDDDDRAGGGGSSSSSSSDSNTTTTITTTTITTTTTIATTTTTSSSSSSSSSSINISGSSSGSGSGSRRVTSSSSSSNNNSSSSSSGNANSSGNSSSSTGSSDCADDIFCSGAAPLSPKPRPMLSRRVSAPRLGTGGMSHGGGGSRGKSRRGGSTAGGGGSEDPLMQLWWKEVSNLAAAPAPRMRAVSPGGPRRHGNSSAGRGRGRGGGPKKRPPHSPGASSPSGSTASGTTPSTPTPDGAPRKARLPDEIDYSELVFESRIGVGAFSEVFVGRWRGTKVAVKRLLVTGGAQGSAQEDLIREFRQEVSMLRRLRHPHIVLFMAAVATFPNLCVVTELLSGSVFDLLHNSPAKLTWKMRLQICLDMAKGLTYLHHIPVIHRDLKSPNLLLDANKRTKVCDFGLARRTSPVMTGQCGTYQWMSPEVMVSNSYSEKADVYSFGIIMWELYARQVPFAGLNSAQMSLAVTRDKLRPTIPAACPMPYAQLMMKCWDADPMKRPTIETVMVRMECFLDHVNSLNKPQGARPVRPPDQIS